MILIKHIDTSFYRLTASQAKALSIDGTLPKEGMEKKAKPASELNKLVTRLVWDRIARGWKPLEREIIAKDYAVWIKRTPLSWHDGEPVKEGWVWAIHIYE